MTDKTFDIPLESILPEWEAMLQELNRIYERCVELGIPTALMMARPEGGCVGLGVNDIRDDINGTGTAMVLDQAIDIVRQVDPDAADATRAIVLLALGHPDAARIVTEALMNNEEGEGNDSETAH